ncbi:hypothetical protein JOD57_000924 [Geodermatophilus bullaregiensis]|nr:hypothetical protein [Geodermatophilus bullaregiensis]MBM7805087.1 hypothetical protein [Geodermatophilus bullaregiensis]
MTRQRDDSPPVVSAVGPRHRHAPTSRRAVPAGPGPVAIEPLEEQQG